MSVVAEQELELNQEFFGMVVVAIVTRKSCVHFGEL